MDENLKSLYCWFDIKRDEIIAGHENERVLISDNKVLGYFSDERTAVAEALSRGLEPGISLCSGASRKKPSWGGSIM